MCLEDDPLAVAGVVSLYLLGRPWRHPDLEISEQGDQTAGTLESDLVPWTSAVNYGLG